MCSPSCRESRTQEEAFGRIRSVDPYKHLEKILRDEIRQKVERARSRALTLSKALVTPSMPAKKSSPKMSYTSSQRIRYRRALSNHALSVSGPTGSCLVVILPRRSGFISATA